MRKISITIILLCQVLFLSAQDMLGIANSNYAGVYGISMNPSGMVASRLYMDYNLIGVQGFVQNNYIYIQRNEFLTILRDRTAPVYYTSENEERNFNIYNNNATKFGFQNLRIMGPSGMVTVGRHSFGLTTALRSISSFQDLPPEMANFIYEAIDYEVQHDILYEHDSKIKAFSAGWFELGFSYAYNFHRKRWNYWSAGISVKPLFGMVGGYAVVDDLEYVVHNDDSASIYNASLELGMALPVSYSTNDYESAADVRGTGVAFDFGITFQRTEKGYSTTVYSKICEKPFEAYNYRIGLSLLDVGFIKYKQNAVKNIYESTYTEWYKPYDTVATNSINGLLSKLDDYFFDNAEITSTAQSFILFLPPTLSLQADIKIRTNTYVNMTGMYGLKAGRNVLYRPSIIAITPRYETARWEVSIPFSVVEWDLTKPRVGFYFRYGNVFIGFDRINTLVSSDYFDGMDVYGGIRLNLSNLFKMNFVKGNCGMERMYNIETFDYRNF